MTTMKATSLLILFMTAFLSAGCFGAAPTGEPLPRSSKGYELYSWQAADGAWRYTLITGTNRLKTVDEVKDERDILNEDGWAKRTVTGTDALLDVLGRVQAGEQIFWRRGLSPATEGAAADEFSLPEESVVAAVRQRCRERNIQLAVEAEDRTNGASQGESTPSQKLEAILDLPERLPAEGGVPLTFTLVNHEDVPLAVLVWYTPLEGIAGEIFRVERNGQPLPYQGILAMRGDPGPENYVLLPPGGSETATVDLEQAYDFTEAGTYTVTFLSPRISHVARTEADMARTVDQLGPVTIVSNSATVMITTGE